jgi:hypothetical protein
VSRKCCRVETSEDLSLRGNRSCKLYMRRDRQMPSRPNIHPKSRIESKKNKALKPPRGTPVARFEAEPTLRLWKPEWMLAQSGTLALTDKCWLLR